MPQIQLDAETFEAAQRRAADEGYSTVDAYIKDVVAHDLAGDGPAAPDVDQLLTPPRLAKIDAAITDIEAGRFYTSEQADEELAKRRAEWLRTNPR